MSIFLKNSICSKILVIRIIKKKIANTLKNEILKRVNYKFNIGFHVLLGFNIIKKYR